MAVCDSYLKAFAALTHTSAFPAHNEAARAALAVLGDALAVPFSDGAIRALLASPEIRAVQTDMWQALQRYESGIERYLAAKGDEKALALLPFYESHALLVAAELALLDPPAALAPHQRLAFIGAGPLPLAPLLYYRQSGLAVTCFGNNAFDAAQGQRFLKKIGVSPQAIRYEPNLDAAFDSGQHPLVIIENRVARKKELLQRVRRAATSAQIGVRSAVGVYSLLYAPLEPQLGEELFMYFDRRTITAPACFKTTYFTAAPTENLIFEKEEPKPDWADVHRCPESLHLTHG